MKFRKKPVVIDAIKWEGSASAIIDWGNSFEGQCDFSFIGGPSGGYVHIRTLEGTMTASIGDWIIRGVKGEFYPCKPDIFAATYEPVSETP